VKVLTDRSGGEHFDSSAQLLVQRTHESLGIGIAFLGEQREGQIDVDHLAKGVHAGVGATGADDHRLIYLQGAGQRFAKNTHHRRELGLVGETGKRVAVVGDVQTPTLDVLG